MTTLVTGATGNLGGGVLEKLMARGATVRALIREPEKLAEFAGRGIDAATGDYLQPETLQKAMEGVERAFLVSSNHPKQVEMEQNFIAVAHQNGVRHIVKLSVLGAGELDSTFQRWHRQIEVTLENSGIAWTHLRPNMMMQNLRWFAQSIKEKGVFYHTLGDAKVSHVDSGDVAEVAAVCLSESGHENKIYTLTGERSLTFTEVAEQLAAALGHPVTYVNITPEQMKTMRLASGEAEWYLDAEAELFARWAEGAGSQITETILQLTGKPPTAFSVYAAQFAQHNV